MKMNEIRTILLKYKPAYVQRLLATSSDSDRLALVFYRDVGEILDVLSRMKNIDRNPTGFSIDDASILGLLVRLWKLFKLVIWIYEEESEEYSIIAERSLIEAGVTATYLLRSDGNTMEDYRRCSYKNRHEMLRQAAAGVPYYDSKAGRRILRSIEEKLAIEELDSASFDEQISNGWRLQGKTFKRIFEEVLDEGGYTMTFGTATESVHGSWHDVRNFSLQQDVNHGFFFHSTNQFERVLGHISTIVPFATLPFREWTQRVDINDRDIVSALNIVDSLNLELFDKYSKLLYDFESK